MAYSFVAAHQANTNNSATTSVTFTLSAGQSLIVFTADGNNPSDTLTVTDSLGNTYTSRQTKTDTFEGTTSGFSDCVSPATTGAVTITCTSTIGATSNTGILVLVYTGLASFDQSSTPKFAHSGWSTATNGAQSNSITPGSQPGMLIGYAGGLGGTITADAGANSRVSNTTWVNAQNTCVEDYRFTGTSGQIANFTFSLATASNIIFSATYLEPGGGNTAITPSVGSDNLTGNAPTVTSATNTVISPVQAFRRSGSGLLVPERKIFLPMRKAA